MSHHTKDRLQSFVPDAASRSRAAAVLVLEDGSRFIGRAYGAIGEAYGEIVFSTGMTGYQETLTDPSYAGQIVLMTAPHIGNTGVNDTDKESRKMWPGGFIVRDPARRVSNFRAERSLDEDLERDGVVGIAAVDTRAITRKIRSAGAMRAGVFSGEAFDLDADTQLERVTAQAGMAGKNLSAEVTTREAYTVPVAEGVTRIGRIAVIDLGIKASTVQYLSEHGFDVHVLPASVTREDVQAIQPDAVFYSNGPGDPAASDRHVELLRALLRDGLP